MYSQCLVYFKKQTILDLRQVKVEYSHSEVDCLVNGLVKALSLIGLARFTSTRVDLQVNRMQQVIKSRCNPVNTSWKSFFSPSVKLIFRVKPTAKMLRVSSIQYILKNKLALFRLKCLAKFITVFQARCDRADLTTVAYLSMAGRVR